MSRQSFSSPLDRLILQLACCTGYLSSPHTEPLASPRPHIRRNNSQRLCMEEHSLPITGLEVRPEIWPQHDVLSLRLLRLLVILRLFKQLNLFSFLKHRRIAARIKTINPYSANQALPVLIHPCQFICNVLVDYCIFSPSDPPFISSLDNLHLLDNIPSEYHSAIRTIYSLGLLDDFFDLFSTGDIRISRAQACIVINRLSSYLTPGNKTTLSGLIIGGQLTVSETTPIDAKILLSNAGCDVFSYSAILALKYYKEGSWVDIPFNSPDNTVSEVAILHQLMPGQEKVFTFDLSYYYGSISEGYYKLEIVLTQNGKNYSLSDIFFISN